MSPNNEPEPRVEIPIPPPPLTPPIFGPTIGTPRLRVRTGPESERDERLVEIDTPRVGSDDNWVQLGPTSRPRDFEAPYAKDKDGDGHTDYGMQVNITPDFVGTIPVVAGAAIGAVAGAGVASVPGAAIGGVAGAAIGHIGETVLDRMNAHYAIGFNVEPGPVVEEVKDKAGDVGDWAKDKAGDVGDWLGKHNPFDGDGLPSLPPGVPPFPFPPSIPLPSGPISMRRLEEAFARLQSLL